MKEEIDSPRMWAEEPVRLGRVGPTRTVVAAVKWWYSGNTSATWTFSQHLAAELSYTCDQVESLTPSTSGREAARHLASPGVKYAF
jgi:hypothetical protein